MKKEQESEVSEFEDPAAEWGFVSFSFGVMLLLLTHIFTIERNACIISQITVCVGVCSIILGIVLAFVIAPMRIENKKIREEK